MNALKLTAEQKQFYQDNGYLAVENVIPPDSIAAERERVAWLCEHWNSPEAARVRIQHEPGLPQAQWNAKTVRVLLDLTTHEPLFRSHALHPNLTGIVADL